MTFIEFIGFMITMFAFFILIVKQTREERKKRQNPEAYENEEDFEQEAVKDLLRSLNVEVPEDSPPAPPQKVELPPIPQKIQASNRKNPDRLLAFQHEKMFRDPYALRQSFEHQDSYSKRKEQQSRVKRLLRETGSLRAAIILKEVLDKPKGLE